ncbi:hypothetical protein ACIRRA_31655 [Nocardia sp. NPDC101769]|uniref:hypothetical protein n=1 Tax=Nocardia sp. NPDC101769 TaxID=3364333 RepID=UPI00380E72BB
MKSTRLLSICELWPLTTSLNRTDISAGEPEPYAIELHVGEVSWVPEAGNHLELATVE